MPKQIEVQFPPKMMSLWQPARYKIYHGGRGSAKSWSIASYLILSAMQRKEKILCAREYMNSIGESVHALLSQTIDRYQLNPYFTVQQNSISCPSRRSEFIFKGLAQSLDSVKSMEGVTKVWLEECNSVTKKSWETLVPTIRAKGSEIIGSYNPDDEKDYIHSLFVMNPPPPGSIVQQVNFPDNCFFPDVLRTEMEHCKATDFQKWRHVWMGEPSAQSAASVFGDKIRSTNFSSAGVEMFRFGMDFGFGSDPSCVVRCFIRDRILHIDHEAYAHGLSLDQLPAFIRSVPGASRGKIWCDASRPETIQYLAQASAANDWSPFNCEAAPKWSGSIEDGIEFIRSFDAVDIHPRCKNSLFDFRSYRYKMDKVTGEILPVLIDKHNHSPDACRYGLAPVITRKTSILDVL